ncbi:MAG: RDD family protein [Gemmatimonadota bacterium]
MPTNVRDPRSIITPDAFGIDEGLLGTPLGRPWPRLWALLIDITVIGILNVLTSGLGVFIWGAVGLFLVQMAWRSSSGTTSQLTARLFRGATGCLGGLVLMVVGVVATANVLSRNDDDFSSITPATAVRTISALGALDDLRSRLQEAETEEEAREILTVTLEILADLDLEDEAQAEALEELIPPGVDFTGDRQAFISALVEGEGSTQEAAADVPPPVSEALRAQVDSLPLETVLSRYSAGLAEGRSASSDADLRALQGRIVGTLASDTLEALADALGEERADRERAERRAEEAVDELARRDSGFVPLLRDIWDQAGSALGLWSIYFTGVMTLSNCFTVGKRIMGLRVVRLDGEPMNWWASFERAGGYVAGIATGLLGFAQIFWDPNRQCVHDKIGRTVVVVAGASPTPGAVESSWRETGKGD